jgi:phage gp29-like protein
MGHFPPGASPDEQAKLLAALAAIRNQAALILPEGMTAELLAASRSGGADYDTAARYWDTAISKIILGHSAGADATPGRLGGEDSSDAVRADLVTADADVLCGSANATWVRWVTEWSVPGAIPPQIWRRTDEEEDLSERADRERKIYDIGYRPTLAQVVDTYGGEWERVQAGTGEALADGETPTTANDTDPPEPPETDGGGPAEGSGARVGEADPDDAPADLAAPVDPQAAPDYAQLTVAALGRLAEPAMQAMATRIREELDTAIAAGEAPADLMARLERLYPQLPDGDLVAVMGEALAAAELAGRFAVMEGRS